MITDLCERAGLDSSLVDVSAVTAANTLPVGNPAGYVIERPMAAAAALQEIMLAFFIDACESGGVLKFFPRAAQSIALTIPETDLGLAKDHGELTEQLEHEQDLPLAVTVMYNDATFDYQQGKQLKARNPRILTLGTRSQAILSLPFTLTPDQARQIAESHLYAAWVERASYSANLWRALYLLLDAGDFVNLSYEGQTFTVRLVSTNIGAGLAVAIETVTDDLRNYVSTAPGGQSLGGAGTGVKTAAPTLAWLLDVPLLRDVDANPGGSGFYAALSSPSPTWGGAMLYESSDDASFTVILTSSNIAANFGFASNALAAPRSPWTWDTANTLTVAMSVGALAGDTDLNVLNGSNVLIVGGEVIQFVDVVENPDGTYTVSRLLRGRRGTEGACGSHAAGETVIAPLGGGIARLAKPASSIGKLRYYRPVSIGGDISTVSSQEFTLAANDLECYAPAGVGGFIDGSGNIVITWARRTRIGGDWLDGTGDVPLSEEAELYDVEILDGSGNVKRTYSGLTTPTAIYLAADQVTDFGSPPASVNVRVYQRSAQIGRGDPATGTAPTPGGWPPAWPEVLTVTALYSVNGA